MSIMNSKAEELHARIASLNKKIKLTNSQEEKALLIDEIEATKEELRKINRKTPNVVVVKDAATVGDKMEAKLHDKGTSRMGNRAVLL